MKTILIYKGRVKLVGGKIGYSYAVLKEGKIRQEMNFSKKLGAIQQIGFKYSCELYDQGVKGPYEYEGVYDNMDDITLWKIQDKALSDQQHLEKQMRKPIPNRYDQHLQGLKEYIKQLSPTQRKLAAMRIFMELS